MLESIGQSSCGTVVSLLSDSKPLILYSHLLFLRCFAFPSETNHIVSNIPSSASLRFCELRLQITRTEQIVEISFLVSHG